MSSVLVLSHNVHPFPRSAEAIVTGALVDALRAAGHDVAVLTSPAGHRPLDGAPPLPPDRCWPVAPAAGLPAWRHLPARDPRGALARSVDRLSSAAGREPFSVSSWARPAAAALRRHLDDLQPGTAVWARGLPESSLAAARRARARRSFPLVCSLGDPLPEGGGPRSGTDAAVARVAVRQVRELGRWADAWTFPSRRVAEGVVEQGGLDPARCFVLPHLLPDEGLDLSHGGRDPAAPTASGASAPAGRAGAPTAVYAGSAYGWLLRGPLLPALERAARSGTWQPVLALRDADAAARAEVRRLAPSAQVHHDLDPAEAALLVRGADAVLAPGPRADLLYTKVVEALRHGRLVFALTPVPGTTAELVEQAGGVVLDVQDAGPGEVDAALDALAQRARGSDRRSDRPDDLATAATAVAERLSTAAVVERAELVLAYAVAHHRAISAGTTAPEPPTLDPWP